MPPPVNIQGIKAVQAQFKRLGEQAPKVTGAALFAEAEEIMGDSKQNYVPVDTGVLRASGHVQAPKIIGQQASVIMGFGGLAEAYAIIQHEDLTLNHPVGEAKYLERPFLKAAQGLAKRLSGRFYDGLERLLD